MKLSKISLVFLCFPLLLMNTQCNDDDDLQDNSCGQPVIIDNAFYQSAESGDYNLISTEINNNCLTVEVSASGCDGESWSMVLVDSGSVAESFPEQRYLKFVFTNNEACLAVFNKSRVFNLKALQVDGSNEVILNIEGFPEAINYVYP